MRRPTWYRPESDRYLTLDALRFAAACAIVLLHYGNQAAWTGVWIVPRGGLQHLQMAVDLFFLISGVMMADIHGGRLGDVPAYLQFLRRRVARLAPLHYATLAVIALAALAPAALHRPRAFDTCGFASNLVMAQAFGVCDHLSFNKPAWSISAEMGLYLALPAFLWLARRRALALALVAAMLAYALLADPRGWPNWVYLTFDFGMLRGAPAFLLGIVLAQTPGLARLPAPRILMALALGLLVAECAVACPNAIRLATLYAVGAAALAIDRQGRAGPIARATAPLGRLTYSIYMLHHLVAALLITAVAETLLGLTGAGLNLIIAAAGLVVLPAVSALSLVAFEGPMRRWISGQAKAPEPEPRGLVS